MFDYSGCYRDNGESNDKEGSVKRKLELCRGSCG